MAQGGLIQARKYALNLIKFRVRAEKEVRDKLKKKEYPPEIIEQTIESLKKQKFLDDRLFAKLWVESRIKRSLGLARLRFELKNKGVSKDLIEEALDRVRESYDEKEAVKTVIRQKLEKMKHLSLEKTRSRLFSFLVRRGYPKGLVIEMLMDYCRPGKDEIIEE